VWEELFFFCHYQSRLPLSTHRPVTTKNMGKYNSIGDKKARLCIKRVNSDSYLTHGQSCKTYMELYVDTPPKQIIWFGSVNSNFHFEDCVNIFIPRYCINMHIFIWKLPNMQIFIKINLNHCSNYFMKIFFPLKKSSKSKNNNSCQT
jgi:hypothetical protein